MRGVTLIPPNTRLPFIQLRRAFFVFSATLAVATLVLLVVRGLNFGVDFVGGVLIEVRTEGAADLATMRGKLNELGLGEVALQEFGREDEVLIRLQRQPGGEEAQQAAVNRVRAALGEGISYRRTEFVGPKVSEELFRDGVYAVIAAMAGILLYVWFRFEWQFGLAGVVALVHDVLITVGVFSLLGFEFNLTIVAALLTIAGYSINDTVVIFDRVRENLRKYKTMPFPDLLNQANNETLSRTVNTGLTTLIALLALYILGGEAMRGFTFAILFGIVIGTYSSVCLAVPLLLYLDIRPAPEPAAAAEAPPQESP
jgi:preprotein translocase subunit SecF